jgi:glucose/arabinose dehydrogenase
LEIPWGIAFMPDGDMLVTERPGRLRQIGKNPRTIGIPSIAAVGEGGLMGIVLHPQFAENNFVYLFYTAQIGSQKLNRVTRFKLEGDHLTVDKVIIDSIPSSLYHDGGLLAFGPDGMLYVADASLRAIVALYFER